MVKIRAGGPDLWLFSECVLTIKAWTFSSVTFWFSDVGLDRMKAAKVSKDENFRKTQKA